MLYYYYKKTGEVEWKSYPYHSFTTIKNLPIKRINFSNKEDKTLSDTISEKFFNEFKVKILEKNSTIKKILFNIWSTCVYFL